MSAKTRRPKKKRRSGNALPSQSARLSRRYYYQAWRLPLKGNKTREKQRATARNTSPRTCSCMTGDHIVAFMDKELGVAVETSAAASYAGGGTNLAHKRDPSKGGRRPRNGEKRIKTRS